MDNKSSEARSLNMSKIRSKDTGPEKFIRSALFRLGYRFRINRKDLPGKPDIVLPKKKAVIFVQGCFWHQHKVCSRAVLPKSRDEYWHTKLAKNIERDYENKEKLLKAGWRVLWVWECSLKTKELREQLPLKIADWLEDSALFGEIPDLNYSSTDHCQKA